MDSIHLPSVLRALLIWVSLISLTSALAVNPAPYRRDICDNSTASPDPDALTLRIMPLGASITAGVGTTNTRGYRKPLRDQLRFRGYNVNYIGSGHSDKDATFKNYQHEGHSGYVTNQMIASAGLSIARKPNLILINCGTNDAAGTAVSTTGERMQKVLEYLFKEVDGVTIVLSTLVPRLDSYASNAASISTQYRALAKKFAAQGKKIVVAEFGNGLLDGTKGGDYTDALHPSDKGARKLAAAFDQAIAVAEEKGFLTKPINTGVPDLSCSTGEGRDDWAVAVDPKLPDPVPVAS